MVDAGSNLDRNVGLDPIDDANRVLPLGLKMGYGIGSISISIAYDFISGFLLFFLTTIAGITPYFAGTIMFIAILWDAVTDPVVGKWSDHSRSKYGKRRPFILASAVPLGLSVALLFLAVDFGAFAKNAYYLIMALIFWTAFTVLVVPYNTLGACMTLNTDERTKISIVRQIFNFFGVLFATALPTFLVGRFIGGGMAPEDAWFYTATILGGLIIINVFATWRATRGAEIFEITPYKKITLNDLIAEVKDIFKLRVYVIIIAALLIYYMGHTILLGSIIFFAKFILNITEDTLSLLYIVIIGGSLAFTFLLGMLAVKLDKRNVFIGSMLFSSVSLIMAKVIGLTTFTQLCVLALFVTVGIAAFATLSIVLVFDVIEVDEFKNGKRREGIIVAYQSFVKKVGAAGSMWLTGILLQLSGFNSEAVVQSPKALATIESLATLYPGILMGLCGLALLWFPVTKKRHTALVNAMKLKKEGKEYSTDEFAEILR
jgi:glycoside/pentoside/hexuronide:cation symporter, GPH family